MLVSEIRDQRMLVATLNWGWGHVSRTIGLICELMEQGNEVVFAGDEAQSAVVKTYFPHVETVFHAPYPFSFSGKGSWATDLFAQRKALLKRMHDEQTEVENWVDRLGITYVLSDHRYGFFSKRVPSIFLTHQVHLPLPWYAGWIQRFHHGLMRSFSHVWILDDPSSPFAGKLSKSFDHPSCSYIGIRSRFQNRELTPRDCSCAFLISGPEPYAEQFFQQCLEQARNTPGKNVILSSRYYPVTTELSPNTLLVMEASWTEMDAYLAGAERWVARAGYSTMMDAAVLQKPVQWVPTPGQAEQLYLATLHPSH